MDLASSDIKNGPFLFWQFVHEREEMSIARRDKRGNQLQVPGRSFSSLPSLAQALSLTRTHAHARTRTRTHKRIHSIWVEVHLQGKKIFLGGQQTTLQHKKDWRLLARNKIKHFLFSLLMGHTRLGVNLFIFRTGTCESERGVKLPKRKTWSGLVAATVFLVLK